MKQRIITLIALLCALAGTASATTKTYTVTGGQDNQGTGFYALFSDGSNSSSQVNWTYNSTAEISFNLRTNLTLTLSNTAKQLVYSNGAIGGRGSTTLTVSSNNNYYIYHVRLLDSSGNVIQLDANGNAVNHGGVSECDYWNMTKSFSHTFSNGILFSKIEVSYATTIPFTDAVISGIDDEYVVSDAAVAPTPTVTWHGTTLTLGTHYTLSYQNNTAAGTATIKVTGMTPFGSTQMTKTYTLVWATYTVHFNKNNDDATGTMSNQNFTYNTAQNLTANAFSRTGYTFAAWNRAANGSGTSYSDQQEVQNLTATNGGTVDLYAQWTAITYSITYDLAGGTVITANPASYSIESNNFTLANPTRTGYTFAGWTGTGLNEPAMEVTIPTGSSGDRTYTATWTAHTYSVHFDANGGTGNMSNQEGFTYDVAKVLTTNAFTAATTGYVFAGWNTQADGSGTSYDDEQSVSNLTATDGATVDLYAQWTHLWGITDGADGTEAKPYVITTPAGLDLLATEVNSGNNYYGKFFKLGADIAYDPNALVNGENYTAIGGYHNGYKYFRGSFDGDGHTVSGIRINKTGSTNADRCQGLFGNVGNSGTVQNVILDGAHITGFSQVGGITGEMNSATIKNCLVLNTAITATASGSTNIGAISGWYSGTLTANYYHNCTLTKDGVTSTTNIGSGQNSVSDREGARSVHALTLPDGVTATGESVVIGTTTYYASNTTVTLSYTKPGYVISIVTVNGSSNSGNSFTMPAEDATVTVTLTDVWNIANDANGSQQHPYVITTPAGLDLLAQHVNSGTEYMGKFFKLGADIAYDPNALVNGENYTAIGGYHNGYKYFQGTFDGDGHTISGIRINKTGSTDADRKQGLFGYVGGTVQNVILNDAHITGRSQVGGITGDMSSATIKNCLVLNTAITATYNEAQAGVISGYSSGTLTANYYHNCTLTKDGVTSTTNIGAQKIDRDGARSVHALTLPAGVTATGESVVIDGTTYYASNTIVTLSCTQPGYDISDVTVNDTPLDGNTFTMPAADATVTATLTSNILYEIAYLDEDGNAQTTPEDVPVFLFTGTETTLGASGETTWYLVNSNITIEDDTNVELAGNVNFILADGSSFNGSFYYYLTSNFASYSLTIYAQSTGDNMGSFNSFWESVYGISALNIHGGNISLWNGGSSLPLFDDYPVSITGGRVSLSSEQACFGEYCTVLGCTAPTDYIYIGGVYAYPTLNVSIKEGQILSDGSHLYSGTLTKRISYDDNEAETEVYRLRGEMVLRLYTGSLLADNDSEKPAGSKNEEIISTLDDGATHTLALQGRIFYKDNQWNTLCLPFDVSSLNGTPLDGATLMELDDSEDGSTGYDASTGTLSLYFKEATSIEAGKPYLMKWSSVDGEFFYNPVFNNVTIDNSAAAQARKTVTSNDGKVSFCSTYDAMSFTTSNKSILFLGGENTLYYPQSGARINACRAYFQLNGLTATDINPNNVKMFFGDERPTDGVGEVQGPKFKVQGEGTWYDLNGRRLSGKPTQKGIYVNNGRKVVIK